MIQAVIGAQYGDEGKGLMVDFLSDHLTLVVRYNGGAQAGHNVVMPDGRAHEFQHFGAGCFKAACTLLSRFFVVNPILFRQESSALAGTRQTVYADPRAVVTTPFDMMLNCAAETARGVSRHGSCGVGVNETMRRAETPWALTVADLSGPRLRDKLEEIAREYVPRRAASLGIPVPAECQLSVLDRFEEDCQFFWQRVFVELDTSALRVAEHVVFEGAQGLRLDAEAPGFPHVTPSRTGLTNIDIMLRDAKIEEPPEVFYVTRAYTTRHGAGPLDGELSQHPYGWTGPEANVQNPHQGRFRYAQLDADALLGAILTDQVTVEIGSRPRLVVTCLDQCGGAVDPEHIAQQVKLPLAFASHGPTRADVRALQAVG